MIVSFARRRRPPTRPSPSTRRRGAAWILVACVVACGSPLDAQNRPEITDVLLRTVHPEADRFSEVEGDPPVQRGFAVDSITGAESLTGYVFLTSDIPPESYGYTAPIQVLVGMDLQGVLTGARVVEYRESLRSSRGDFLGRPGIQGQFAGKSITEPFRVRQDVDNITGATITVAAMALGIRNAARRVAVAYLTRAPSGPPPRIASIELEQLDAMTWPEMLQLELVRELVLDPSGTDPLTVSFAYLRDAEIGERIVGATRFPDALRRAGPAAEEVHWMLLGINGGSAAAFRPDRIAFVQDGDTIRVAAADFVSTGVLPDGKAQGEFRRTGLLLVDRTLDVARPFTIEVTGSEEGTVHTVEYRLSDPPPPPPALAEVAPGPEAADAGTAPVETVPEGDADAAEAEEEDVTPPTIAGGSGGDAGPAAPDPAPLFEFTEEDLAQFLFEDGIEEESGWARTLAQTSWWRVGWLLALLGLVTLAFVTRSAPLRWVSLAVTLGYLGFLDRGFLSVSHITAGITVGPEVYLADLPLLILAVFTVGTTLFVGRVFCGFLCPFGALQDLLDRIVPKGLRRELPPALHRKAFWAKYGILGLVLAPAVLGIPLTLYHWFEPFGTVFFRSPSILLWGIAGGILVTSAIVPRFYCRYACPLGAALALGSLLAPFRIRRVEACTICKVCEQKCPTGAIEGPHIDFKECVRCSVCEIQLRERTGVCRHDMAKVRSRLVQLRVPAPGGSPR